MASFLITYDLNNEVKRPKITKRLKEKYPAWAMLSESSYAVVASGTATSVYKSLSDLLDDDDQLYVIPLRKPWYGFGPKDVNDWLDNNLDG